MPTASHECNDWLTLSINRSWKVIRRVQNTNGTNVIVTLWPDIIIILKGFLYHCIICVCSDFLSNHRLFSVGLLDTSLYSSPKWRQTGKSGNLFQILAEEVRNSFNKWLLRTQKFQKENCKELIPIAELNGVASLCKLFDALGTVENGVSYKILITFWNY